MTGHTISKIAQQIAQKTDGNAVQIEEGMKKKILNAINTVSDSKKYTINDIELMLTSYQAKKQILCLKKDIQAASKSGRIMSGGNGADELATVCCWSIVGIVALVIFLSNASDGEAFIMGAILASGGGKRKTRKRSRKKRKKRRKISKKKRN